MALGKPARPDGDVLPLSRPRPARHVRVAAGALSPGARHILRRAGLVGVGAPILSIALAMLVVAMLLRYIDVSPVAAASALVDGAIGSQYAIGTTMVRATPLIFAGLAVGLAFRAGLFNIGAEGQLQMGALATTLTALYTGSAWLSLLAGVVGGAFWSTIAGWLKAWRGVNEIITTIMLNFIAIDLVNHLVGHTFTEPGAPFPATPPVPVSARLLPLIGGTRLNLGFLLAILLAFLVFLFLTRTTLGARLRAVGANPAAAAHAGSNVPRCILTAMALSGGCAGLAGATEILGVQYRLGHDWSSGWGFQAISVAFLAQGHPAGIVLVGLLYGMLVAGASNMQAVTGVPISAVWLIQSLPVIFLIALTARRRQTVAAPPERGDGGVD